MHLLLPFLCLAIGADSAPNSDRIFPSTELPATRVFLAQSSSPMPGMTMGNMPIGDMAGMNMGGTGGMSGMDMAGIVMPPSDIAMGRMAFMNVMGSRAEPGILMKLLHGFEPQKDNMGSMNGISMGNMDSMPGMSMNKKLSSDVAAERAKLSPEDRRLVNAQDRCPITRMQLGTMGPPIKMTLNNQIVFLCCKECVAKAQADPQGTLAELAKMNENKSQGGMDMPGMDSMNGMPMGNMGSMDNMKRDRFSLSGWTDMSFTASTATTSNLPMGFNFAANRFLLQQNWLRADWAVDEQATRPSFGFRSDWVLPGTDYVFTLPRDLLNAQLTASGGAPNLYGIDPFQFYGEVYLPNILHGMDIKVGRFCMLNGVEMSEATMNLLPSHSYLFLADPFTHTGILTTTRVTNQFVVQAAITAGSDVFFGPSAEPTFAGAVKWFSANEHTNIAF
ncbi:MAG TPA: outer membrane beta-barrel protein, partial [Gemmataceae bacterium]|nr:outer membrane beta-barrel protein [Gemmataceae bacterium]